MLQQFMTFYIDDQLYGMDVMNIQEVTKKVKITPLMRSLPEITGLINLRGRVATGIELGRVFDREYKVPEDFMTIVCEYDGDLYSLVVDRVGDVIHLDNDDVSTKEMNAAKDNYIGISGIFQTEDKLMRVVDIKTILITLNDENNKGDVA